MKSILLCEGPDDLWFIGYYLHKTAGWDTCKPDKFWRNYQISPINKKQQVQYFSNGQDCVAIWCVAGKDCFETAIRIIRQKFIANYPHDPPNTIVIVRDRDNDSEEDVLSKIESFFSNEVSLSNQAVSNYSNIIDGFNVDISILPLIIPFDEEGAIETVLMNSIRDKDLEGSIVVTAACSYIKELVNNPLIGTYLTHNREVLKAKYAAAIAVTNPGHSTGLFQDMVLSCPWEQSESVKKHFDCITTVLSSL